MNFHVTQKSSSRYNKSSVDKDFEYYDGCCKVAGFSQPEMWSTHDKYSLPWYPSGSTISIINWSAQDIYVY